MDLDDPKWKAHAKISSMRTSDLGIVSATGEIRNLFQNAGGSSLSDVTKPE